MWSEVCALTVCRVRRDEGIGVRVEVGSGGWGGGVDREERTTGGTERSWVGQEDGERLERHVDI